MKNFKLGLVGFFLVGFSLFCFSSKSQAVKFENRTIIGSDNQIEVSDGQIVPHQSSPFITVDRRLGSPIYNHLHQVIGDVAYASNYYNFGTKFNSEYFEFVSKYSGVEAENIFVEKEKVTLNTGETREIIASVLPLNAANKKLYWDTTADLIATVDQNGKITGMGPGVTIIDVSTSDGKITKYIEVTVTNEVSPKEIILEKESVELKAGESLDLNVTVLPENTTNKNLIWNTTDEEVVTVDANGRITGINPGFADIEVTTVDGKVTQYIEIFVDEVGPKEIVVENDYIELNVGESTFFKASVLPENTTDKMLFWTSMDDSIAFIDDNGKITGNKAGTTEIWVLSMTNFGDIEKFVTVTIKDRTQEPIEIAPKEIILEKETVELNVGESMNVKTTVLPENTTNKQLIWNSTDEGIATVDETGRITGIEPDSVYITVETADGKIKEYIEVVVNEVAPEEIVVENDHIELNVGESMAFKASILPGNTTDKGLFWTSMDDSIAFIDDNGKITGNKAGTTEIWVLSMTNFGDIEKYVTVTVKEKTNLLNLKSLLKNELYFTKQDR